MQKSGFFNALLTNGQYDRTYNANDYCDNLAVVISNGVLRSNGDDLRVTASGMVVTVGVGRAWINGHYYLNDTPFTFAPVSAPIGGTRYDRVFLRLDDSLTVRSVSLVYQQGTASNNPTKPEPVREGNIYDIVLADIYVSTNATSVFVNDTRGNADICGWVYSTSGDNSFFRSLDVAFDEWFEEKKNTLSSVTLFKRYTWEKTLEAPTNKVQFAIPQYNPETSFISVYVNGIIETEGNDFTLDGAANMITFDGTLTAGTKILVTAYKSIDGTGIESVADEITALQNAVADLNKKSEYEYICTGIDDNVKISQIAQAFLAGTGIFANTPAYAQMRLKIYGTCGVTAAYSGSGTSSSPYKWFALGTSDKTNRKLIVDFSSCDRIEISMSGAANRLIDGAQVHVVGMRVLAICYDSGSTFNGFNRSKFPIIAENCDFDILTTGALTLAENGTFTNCTATLYSTNSRCVAFHPHYNGGGVRVFGGEYRCYVVSDSYIGALLYSTGSDGSGTCELFGVRSPSVAVNGFMQTYAAFVNAGKFNLFGLISPLAISKGNATFNEFGTIAAS